MKIKFMLLLVNFAILLSTNLLANNRYTFESMFLSTGRFGLNDAVLVNDSCVIVCGDKGSIKRSTNRGKTFDLIRYKYYYDDLSGIAMNAHGEIFCSTRSGNLIKSTDQGLTWQEIKLDNPSPFRDIDFWDNVGMMTTEDNGLMLSKDYGETWNAIDFRFDGEINSIEKQGNNFFAADSIGNLWKSIDAENWQIELSHNKSCNSLCSIGDDKLLIAYNNGRIIEYIPSEHKTIELPKLDTMKNIMHAFKLNDTTYYIITKDRFLSSIEHCYLYPSSNWNYSEPYFIDNIIYYKKNKFGIGMGYGGRIMVGNDTIKNSQSNKIYGNIIQDTNISSKVSNVQFSKLTSDNENELIANCDIHRNSILVSNDSCQSFKEIKLLEAENSEVVFVHKIDIDKYIISIDTTTEWVNWNAKKKSRFYLYSQEHLTQVYETEVEQNVDKFAISDSIFIFYRNGVMYLSKDYGADWVKIITPNNELITQLILDKEHKIHLTAQRKIYTSSDYGTTWEFIDSVSKYINCFEVLDNGQYLRVASSSVGNSSPYSLYINDPNTKEWKSIYEGVVNNYSSCFNLVKLNDEKVVLISNNDIILISDNYTKCEKLIGNRPFFIFKFLNSIKVNDNTIYLCAMDSIYRIRLSLDSTADVSTEIIEEDITIDSQASSGAVTIRSTDAKVLESIEVFDQNGLSVDRINNILSDSYKLNTETLSAGLYLIKINSDGKEFLKKILKY